MGMFNYVNYSAPCPKCGAIVNDWQTKDGMLIMTTVEPWSVSDFYGRCSICGMWIDATVDAEVETVHTVKRCDIKLTLSQY